MGELANAQDLRSRAEAALRKTERDVSALAPEEVQRLVHELQVHQIELEMQNDELRRAQAALEESRGQLQVLFDNAPAGYLDVDADGVIVRANVAAGKLLGIAPARLPGRRLSALVVPDDLRQLREHLRAVFERGEPAECDLSLLRSGGSSLAARLDSSPRQRGCLTLVTDISERKRAEGALFRLARELEERVEARTGELADKNRRLQFEMAERSRAEQERQHLETRLRSAERLQSLANLAGGIAHDFNNLLVGVLGNADLLLGEQEPTPAMRESLSLIKQSALAATNLTRQMLVYAGHAQRNVKPVDATSIVEEALESARPQAPEGVRLVGEISSDVPDVLADEGQLRELVTHLIMNGLEATGEAKGQVTVRVYAVAFDEQELGAFTLRAGAAPGRYVVLAVDDTGHGMDAAMRARAFDPFFTTKFAGRGLGLASVLGVVRGHHGALNLWSEPGHGTSIQVALPAASRAGDEDPALRSRRSWAGSGNVLLIDDDELVRGVLARQLGHMGFSQVVQAASGREGLDCYAEQGQKFSVVVLDRTMPGLSGEQVLLKLRELDAEVPVLMISGYSADDVDIDDPRVAFLQKPMTEADLMQALGGLIDSQAAEVQ